MPELVGRIRQSTFQNLCPGDPIALTQACDQPPVRRNAPVLLVRVLQQVRRPFDPCDRDQATSSRVMDHAQAGRGRDDPHPSAFARQLETPVLPQLEHTGAIRLATDQGSPGMDAAKEQPPVDR
ncbi:hypothetical protein JOF29_002797 [Kribbella aluminosa]|uniref:Uncharacterized protein n=1 Tax=Kribbella aluminosa TaxID=416017 RepID=A0ABS4UJK5_9ACTN|nr:hypothetical protein [Kribbella aluminosa]MBP2351714.1 hypothetical protein [Kribbella aluminosa]